MDPSFILLRGWDPSGVSSDLEGVPYSTLWLESCDALLQQLHAHFLHICKGTVF